MLHKIISMVLSFNLILAQSGFCQGAFELNLGQYLGQMNRGLSIDRFRPLRLRYFSYDTATNNFQLLLDKGDDPDIKDEELQDKTKVLMEYFQAGLSLSNDKFWVNLRPDSEDEIIDPLLERTDLGKVMLESDLQLKKDTAAFTSPQSPEGRLYWDKLYQKARELFGSEPANIPTLTRPWIVPGEIIVKETDTSAYIYKANMKVMLEEDYLKTTNPIASGQMYTFSDPRMKELNAYSTQLIREMILPKLTKEVNTAKRYAGLRQVFFSLVMARWFKERFRGKQGEYPQLIDSQNLEGLTSKEPWSKSFYFNEYKKSFENGEYNLKEQVSTISGQVIRSYVSGGMNLGPSPKNMHTNAFTTGKNVSILSADSSAIVAGNPKEGMLVLERNNVGSGFSPLTALQKAEYDFYEFKTIIKTYADGRHGVRPGESDLGTNVSYELYNDRQEAIDAARKVARKIFGINELIDGIFANGMHSAFPEFLENERKFYIRVGLIINFGEDSQGEVFLGINKDMRPLDSILRSEVEKYTGDREALQKVRDIAGRRFGADEMLKQIMELSARGRSSSSPLTNIGDPIKSWDDARKALEIIKPLDIVARDDLRLLKKSGSDLPYSIKADNSPFTAIFLGKLHAYSIGDPSDPNAYIRARVSYGGGGNVYTIGNRLLLEYYRDAKSVKESYEVGKTDSGENAVRLLGENSVIVHTSDGTFKITRTEDGKKFKVEEAREDESSSPIANSEEKNISNWYEARYVARFLLPLSNNKQARGLITTDSSDEVLAFLKGLGAEEKREEGVIILLGNKEIVSYKQHSGDYMVSSDADGLTTVRLYSIDGDIIIADGPAGTVKITREPMADAGYTFTIEKAGRGNEVNTDSSSAGSPVAENKFGGIDFRQMDMLIQPMGSFSGLNFSLPVLSAATLEAMDLDKELEDIRNMVKAGVIPSGERVKEYLAACFQKGRMAEKQDGLLLCLSEIYRLQEEEVMETSPELRESLVIVETGNFVLTS